MIGDYVSYMTATTKETRRNDWKALNFAGTVDWAVDLQEFSNADKMTIPNRPASGNGCVSGEDRSENTGDLCSFTCTLGFCPETLCRCISQGDLEPLPQAVGGADDVMARDEFDVDTNRLCRFSCKYGYCPGDICFIPEPDAPDTPSNLPVQFNPDNGPNWARMREENLEQCPIYKNYKYRDVGMNHCKNRCQVEIDKATEESGRANWGCVGHWPGQKSIPWQQPLGSQYGPYAIGKCLCNSPAIDWLADTFIEFVTVVAQVCIWRSVKIGKR